MQSLTDLQKSFETYLTEYTSSLKEPKNLYAPINYILHLGGKHIRPVLTLLTAEVFGKSYEEALNAALAVEVFHNFTLMHDDIMDDAPLRRGKTTVHQKWDVNAGILSGDAMLILSNHILGNYTGRTYSRLMQVFNTMALEVCEGQQYDIDFETRVDVSIKEYLKMIKYKTSVLVGTAMKMGAIVANASERDQDLIYEFGKNLGIAFQIQDDYLDAFGNPETFGKQVGGDIIENKKTYLYLKALELGDDTTKDQLVHLYSLNLEENTDKIDTVKRLFEVSEAIEATSDAIIDYTEKAFFILNEINLPEEKTSIFKEFGLWLMKRNV